MSDKQESTRSKRGTASLGYYEHDVITMWRLAAGSSGDVLDDAKERLLNLPKEYGKNRLSTLVALFVMGLIISHPLALLLTLAAGYVGAPVNETAAPFFFADVYGELPSYFGAWGGALGAATVLLVVLTLGFLFRHFHRRTYYKLRDQALENNEEFLKGRAQQVFSEGQVAFGELADLPSAPDDELADKVQSRFLAAVNAADRLDALLHSATALYNLVHRHNALIDLLFIGLNAGTIAVLMAVMILAWGVDAWYLWPVALIIYIAVVQAWVTLKRKHGDFTSPPLPSSGELYEYGASRIGNLVQDLDVARRNP